MHCIQRIATSYAYGPVSEGRSFTDHTPDAGSSTIPNFFYADICYC